MRAPWRLSDVMALVVVVAIYLAAIHSLTLGPGRDSFTVWQQLVSFVLLFFIIPFHIMAAWSWLTARRQE